MRTIVARLRGPRAPRRVPAITVDAELVRLPQAFLVDDVRPYADAITEAFDQCKRFGMDLEPNPDPDYDASSLVRHTYGAGWLACESRLASPDMADLIYRAIKDPSSVIEPGSGDIQHQVRAVQQIVTYGVKSETH